MSLHRPGNDPHRLSVVVVAPRVAGLEDTLVSVLEHRPDDCDIIVALGERYDDPWQIGDEVTFVNADRRSGLVGCATAGLAVATGDVIHLLAAGWKATADWTAAAMTHFTRPDVAAVVPLAMRADDAARPVATGVRRTSGGRSIVVVPRLTDAGVVTGSPPHAPLLEAGFWRAETLRSIGISSACGDALAAADLAAGLKASGGTVAVEPACTVIAGPMAKRPSSFRAGLHAERLFWRSLPCERTIPASIFHATEIVRHAVATAPLGTVGMLAGRLAALLHVGSCRARTRQLRDLLTASKHGSADAHARTFRIDAPHDSASPPHAAPRPRELKRSA